MERCVRGIPTAAATPVAAVIPGTTSKAIPARASASASSPPRPKMNGSPPFNRTMRLPWRASDTSSRLISPCVIVCRPRCLPA